MPTWYEKSNASGLFVIEWASAAREDRARAWIVRRKEKTIATGPDAEGALAALVASGQATELRLPKRLLDWDMKRR